MQLLVEKNKNLDFKEALELAADVQPIKVNPQVIDDVSSFLLYKLQFAVAFVSVIYLYFGIES